MLLEQGDLLLDAEFPCKEEIYVYTYFEEECVILWQAKFTVTPHRTHVHRKA